jgi:hypothetical protein
MEHSTPNIQVKLRTARWDSEPYHGRASDRMKMRMEGKRMTDTLWVFDAMNAVPCSVLIWGFFTLTA